METHEKISTGEMSFPAEHQGNIMQNEQIEIDTRLGKQRIDPSRVIVFPKGLIGFEDKRRFTLIQIKEGASMLILQSLEDPALGLLVADPYSFLPEFSVRLGDAEQNLLQAESAGQLSILVTVSIPAGKPEETCLNLSGPILINHEGRLGLQVPQVDPTQPAKLFLHQESGPAPTEQKKAKG